MTEKGSVRIDTMLAAILKWTKKNKSWLLALSIIVVFCTTYALILPALTLEEQEAARQGGIELASDQENTDSTADAQNENQDADDSNASAESGLSLS